MTTSRLPLSIAILIFLLFNTALFADNYQTYTIKEKDTLESLAIQAYSKLPYSEPIPFDNRYRGILIYKENRESLGLEMTFKDYEWDPVIVLNPGENIKIPVCKDGYPTVSELKTMILNEMESVKLDIKKKNESVILQKISDRTTDEIIKIVLSPDESGELILEEAVYNGIPYILTDGTVLLQSRPSELDIFVWQIIEHRQSDKTIFIFPDTYTSLVGSYNKFVVMNEISQANIDRNIIVFLESIDDFKDNKAVDKFYRLRKNHNYYDFLKILTLPQKRAPMNPSMALFFQTDSINLKGLEDRGEILKFFTAGEKEIKDRINKKYEKYQAGILDHFNRYYTLQIDLFLKEIETEILKSAEINHITDNYRINLINELQLEFAKIYVEEDFLEAITGNEDVRVENILLDIDRICGSDTSKFYLSFKKEMLQKQKEDILKELEGLFKEEEDILSGELDNKLLTKREEIISEIFSSLPDGSVGICELGVAHIHNQLRLCLEKRNYNLVIFHHPLLNDSLMNSPWIQDPEEHEETLRKYMIPDDVFQDLIIPIEYKKQYETDSEKKDIIDRSYIILKSMKFYYEDELIQAGRSIINYRNVQNLGCILRLARHDENNNVSTKFYFIPGKNIEERINYIEETVSTGNLNDVEKKHLLKWAKIVKASMNL